jgi:hypothetical protein
LVSEWLRYGNINSGLKKGMEEWRDICKAIPNPIKSHTRRNSLSCFGTLSPEDVILSFAGAIL